MSKIKENVGASRRKASGSRVARVPSSQKPRTLPSVGRSTRSRADAQAKRHELYKSMLAKINAGAYFLGFCSLLRWEFDIRYSLRRLPELYAQKPAKTEDESYWWRLGAKAPRIRALKAAIKASAPVRPRRQALGARPEQRAEDAAPTRGRPVRPARARLAVGHSLRSLIRAGASGIVRTLVP